MRVEGEKPFPGRLIGGWNQDASSRNGWGRYQTYACALIQCPAQHHESFIAAEMPVDMLVIDHHTGWNKR
jgi:hypothetical protein